MKETTIRKEWESFGTEETRRLGCRFGEEACPGQVYALSGDLGVGKTVFAQGFAAGLGIEGPVSSPTFTIMQLYGRGRLPLCHMDAYRLENEEELEAIGGHEYFGGRGVCLVEWPERVEELLPEDTFRIRIEKDYDRGPDFRRITLTREVRDETAGC